jgi:hypothetical protein
MVAFVLSPQLKVPPVVTCVSVPAGFPETCPELLKPQHSSVAFVRTAQLCPPGPAETCVNVPVGAPEDWPLLSAPQHLRAPLVLMPQL